MQDIEKSLNEIGELVLFLPENESEEHGKPKQHALSMIEETKRKIEGFLTDAEVEAIQEENEQLKLDLMNTEERVAELERDLKTLSERICSPPEKRMKTSTHTTMSIAITP